MEVGDCATGVRHNFPCRHMNKCLETTLRMRCVPGATKFGKGGMRKCQFLSESTIEQHSSRIPLAPFSNTF